MPRGYIRSARGISPVIKMKYIHLILTIAFTLNLSVSNASDNFSLDDFEYREEDLEFLNVNSLTSQDKSPEEIRSEILARQLPIDLESLPPYKPLIRFEAGQADISRQQKSRRLINKFIQNSDPAGLVEYLKQNPHLKYSNYDSLEHVMLECIDEGKYDFVLVLLNEGVRITNGLEDVMLKVIDDGQSEILDKMLQAHIFYISLYLDCSVLVARAVEIDNIDALKILMSYPMIASELTQSHFLKMARSALKAGKIETLNSLMDLCDKSIKEFVIDRLLLYTTDKNILTVVELHFKNKLPIMGFSVPEKYKLLQVAAEKGNILVTQRLMKNLTVHEYVERNYTAPDSPAAIAKKNLHWEIAAIYDELFG